MATIQHTRASSSHIVNRTEHHKKRTRSALRTPTALAGGTRTKPRPLTPICRRHAGSRQMASLTQVATHSQRGGCSVCSP